MKTSTKYLLLAVVFFVAYLVFTYSGIYGSSGWFRAFLAILTFVYVVAGLNHIKKENRK